MIPPGTLTATSGLAAGQTSTDIGVSEGSSTGTGVSLQLTGTGSTYSDFSWVADVAESFGEVNDDMTFGELRVRTNLEAEKQIDRSHLSDRRVSTVLYTRTQIVSTGIIAHYHLPHSDVICGQRVIYSITICRNVVQASGSER